MSRGYDGPEIDDFRHSAWERERANSSGDWGQGSGTDWRTRANAKLKLQKVREAESRSDHAIAQNREHSNDSFPALSRESRQAAILNERDRSQYTDRERTYVLRRSEIHTLTEIGKFRVVSVEDLATFAYNGDRERMQRDLRSLARQGLVEHRGTSPLKKESRRVLTLTEQGQRLIRRHGFLREDQAIYSGLVKPKEAEHDTALYRMYHKAADEIERKGGKVLGVQLDYELKTRPRSSTRPRRSPEAQGDFRAGLKPSCRPRQGQFSRFACRVRHARKRICAS